MEKLTLRLELANARNQQVAGESMNERSRRGRVIAKNGLALPQLQPALDAALAEAKEPFIASYDSLATEPPTDQLNTALGAAGFHVLVPIHKVNGRYLDTMLWSDTSTGRIVASSPQEFHVLQTPVVFTPALAVGRNGTRLGKGKGFYDRFFAQLPRYPDGPLRVAIVGAHEVFESVPTDLHDEPIDHVIVG